jgi:hypothetical protein
MSKQRKSISLAPLSFEEAVADILKIKPEPKAPKRPKAKKLGKSNKAEGK